MKKSQHPNQRVINSTHYWSELEALFGHKCKFKVEAPSRALPKTETLRVTEILALQKAAGEADGG